MEGGSAWPMLWKSVPDGLEPGCLYDPWLDRFAVLAEAQLKALMFRNLWLIVIDEVDRVEPTGECCSTEGSLHTAIMHACVFKLLQ